MHDDRRPDDRFAMIREALVELGLAPAHDRQAQARGALHILGLDAEQRRDARAAHLLGEHFLCRPEECRLDLSVGG